MLDTWRLFTQRQSPRTLTQIRKALGTKPQFRKHWAQPHYDERITDEKRERMEDRFSIWWGERRQQHRLSPRLRFLNGPEPTSQGLPQAASLTQDWLSRFSHDGTVVPRRLSAYEFPTGYSPRPRRPTGLLTKRTKDDKRRSEAVLTTPFSELTEYVSPEMMEMIKESPLITRGENAIVFRSHMYSSQKMNLLECFRLLSRFIRNVASEIVYREQRIAAEERMYREKGASNNLE